MAASSNPVIFISVFFPSLPQGNLKHPEKRREFSVFIRCVLYMSTVSGTVFLVVCRMQLILSPRVANYKGLVRSHIPNKFFFYTAKHNYELHTRTVEATPRLQAVV